MDDLKIPLSAEMLEYLDKQATRGGYASVVEYVQKILEYDRKRKAEEELEAKLLQGINSEGEELTDELMQKIIQRHQKAEKELEDKLLEGLRSKPLELTDADWDSMLEEALKKAQNKDAA